MSGYAETGQVKSIKNHMSGYATSQELARHSHRLLVMTNTR
jgi:hypothetical protein